MADFWYARVPKHSNLPKKISLSKMDTVHQSQEEAKQHFGTVCIIKYRCLHTNKWIKMKLIIILLYNRETIPQISVATTHCVNIWTLALAVQQFCGCPSFSTKWQTIQIILCRSFHKTWYSSHLKILLLWPRGWKLLYWERMRLKECTHC